MAKQLEVGRDYWTVFGDANQGKHLIYQGGITFRAINDQTGQTADRESQDTYNKVLAWINAPTIKMGQLG